MIKHKKYRILGVTFILLLVLSIVTIAPTYAAKKNNGEIIETELTCDELADQYGLYITQDTNDNEFVLIRDESYAESCANNDGPKPDLKLIKINGIDQNGTQVLDNKNKKIKFKAAYIDGNDNGRKYEYITVLLETIEEEPKQVEVSFEATNEEALEGSLSYEENTHFNGICATFRNEVATKDAEAQTFFKDAVAYCWKDRVPVGTNYTASEINSKISGAKASWNAFTSEESTQTPSFNTAFNSIQGYAQQAGHDVTIGNKAPKFSLKCRYDYIKKAGAVYTNSYGEVIESNNDYYLNKDYYFGTQTTSSGTKWEYTYRYAPGNTKTEKLNGGAPTCERVCEEAVKVEYGPPIASKAGLCFEYKVKVTSYVKCRTKFTAKPPKQDTGYCNPPPRCVSTKGVERKKPQAGPNQEFDSCIAKCDGGKYTQACSTKCYNEVYGNKKGAKKLAVNYESSIATPLANSGYSLSQCLSDNSAYYGCYYYDGGTIRWKEAGSHNDSSISSLGRWYIEANRGGYDLSGLHPVSGQRRYIADTEGFYRAIYASGPCTDICSWKHDCRDKYLNPGTAAKDYKENEKTYEDARRECAAGVTCTTKTTDLTISVNYDTKEKDKIVKTTIDFPIENKKETITSKETGYSTTKQFGQESTLLDIDGCYINSDQKNWYLSEWSFPGTYIHNKTGEISFKKPSDSSGWYYEHKKFCMPLNALSVNSKWWEWKVLADANFDESCYTRADIENELATNNGTSNGYNIHASAKNFGYFGWEFNIGCFYALRNEVCDIDETKSPKKCCKPPVPDCKNPPCDKDKAGLDYMVRTVDRANLFPNSGTPGVIVENTRPIGFNWTEAATILNTKNPNYHVDPAALRTNIENKADNLYSDPANLDYQFHLTPSTLRKIREYNRNYSYGTWNGKVETKNGINVYFSNLWNSASGSIEKNVQLKYGDEIKVKGTPGVNNERG